MCNITVFLLLFFLFVFLWCKLQSISVQIPPSGKFKLLNSLVKLQKIGKTTSPPTPPTHPHPRRKNYPLEILFWIRAWIRYIKLLFHTDSQKGRALLISFNNSVRIMLKNSTKIKRLIHFKQILIQIQAKYHTHSF